MIGGYVLERTEDAWINYISSSFSASYGNTIDYLRGTQFITDKEGTSIIVMVPSIEEIMMGTGIYRGQAQITLAFPFQDSGSQLARNELVTSMSMVVLGNENILNDLSGSGERIRFLDATFGGQQNSFSGDTLLTTYQIDMIVKQVE